MPRALSAASASTEPTAPVTTMAAAADSQNETSRRVPSNALVYAPTAKSPAWPRLTSPVIPTRMFIPTATMVNTPISDAMWMK